jgi:hypothetical protein
MLIRLSECPREHYVRVIGLQLMRRQRVLLLVESLVFIILWSEGIIHPKYHT